VYACVHVYVYVYMHVYVYMRTPRIHPTSVCVYNGNCGQGCGWRSYALYSRCEHGYKCVEWR